MSYGRVEQDGLRCIYHGWVFNSQGACLDQPGEPEGGRHRAAIKQKAYPCIEQGGAIWAYMGGGEPPLFPNYPALSAPDEYRFVTRWRSACNYLQANEGNIDPVHTSYLHAYQPPDDPSSDKLSAARNQFIFGVDTAPRVSVRDAPFGLRVLAERTLPQPGKKLLRVTNFVMPNACAIGGSETPFGRGGASMFWHVPIDDTSHWRYEFIFHSKAALPKEELEVAYRSEMDASGTSWRNASNRFGQRRDEMHRSFLGMGQVFPTHDLFVTESQGAILDRGAEHLVTSDVAIVRARRILATAMADVAQGKDPIGLVRCAHDNDFRHLLVLTEVVDVEQDLEAFFARLTAEDIYQLNAAVSAAAAAAALG